MAKNRAQANEEWIWPTEEWSKVAKDQVEVTKNQAKIIEEAITLSWLGQLKSARTLMPSCPMP